jgi:micrococcal nuclease
VTKPKSFQWLVVCAVLTFAGQGFAEQGSTLQEQEETIAPLSAKASAAKRISGVLVKVTDGDTVTVSAGGKTLKVRYLGMDAPELHFQNKSQGKWGQEASDHLLKIFNAKPAKLTRAGGVDVGGECKDATTGKPIQVEVELQGKDKYKRDLGYVSYKGTVTNLQMVKDGYAHPYLYCTTGICDRNWFTQAHVQDYVDACKAARKAEVGVWQKGLRDSVQTASQFRRITGGSKPYQFIGDYDTKKLYSPQEYADMEDSTDASTKPDPCVAIRFQNEVDAQDLGYKY